MLSILLRLWLIITICWWGYNLYLHRGEFNELKGRNWGQAFQYGINNFFCDIKIFGNCHDLSIPFFQRSLVNETFGLIVTFVGYPILALTVCFLIAWIFRKPRKA